MGMDRDRREFAGAALKLLKSKAVCDMLPPMADGIARLVPLLPDDTVAMMLRLVGRQGGDVWLLTEDDGRVRYLRVTSGGILGELPDVPPKLPEAGDEGSQ